MAITEALRIVIDADARGAVQGINDVGKATDRELGRSQKTIDQWSRGLTTAGVAMIGVGSAALFGLGRAAMASEEANLATVKLENTLANMPKLAGESSKQFIDLAESIQDVTAADADAIVEAEALLGTFNLTANEIKAITPLVVDYARKFGVDLPSAATQVGKALDGNIGALKRVGISIDETAFAADRFGAVQSALRDQVGGFAEAEGKTFAGSLERMKNELGDLAEGVGVGAVEAFSKMFGVIDGVTGRLNELSPAAQSTIGQVATFASVGLIAAGGLSVMIGQIIKARENFVVAREAIAAFAGSGGLGMLARTGLVIGGLIALREVVMALDDDLKGLDVSKLENELLDLAETSKFSGEQLETAFEGIGDAFDSGDPQKLEAMADRLGEVDKALAQLAGRDPSEAAAAFREITKALEEQGLSGEQIKRFFNDYAAAVASADTAARTGAGGTDELTGAMTGAADATGEATSALEEYNNALQAQFDPLFGAVNASHQLAEANQKVAEAEVAVAEAVRDHGAGSAEATAAQAALTEAQIAATSAALGQESALVELSDAVGNGTVSLQGAKQKLQEWVAQGLITQATADTTAAKFDELTGAALAVPTTVSTDVFANTFGARLDIAGVGAALNDIDGRVANVTVKVTAQGQAALNLIDQKLLGFASGGVVPGPKGSPQLVVAHGGETMVPTHDPGAMREFMPQSFTSAPGSPGASGSYVDNRTFNIMTAADPQGVIEAIKRYERSNGPGWRN